MKKISTLLIIWLVLMSISVLANGDHETEIEEGRVLIENKVSCDNLIDEQLESIGDYYMEQMHPGEEHEVMDEMMGGEGSESLHDMHIQMARSMYCGEGMMQGGMMMMGRGMMDSGGMMGVNKDYKTYGGKNKMMGNWFTGFSMWGIVFKILFWGLIIWLIIWIITKYNKPKKSIKTESAVEILRKRYAKGDITKKQYEEMKKELQK